MTNKEFRFRSQEQSLAVRSSALIVENQKVLTIHAESLDKYYLPGGALLANESSDCALVRELQEELKLQAQLKSLAFVLENRFSLQGRDHHNIEFLYQVAIEDCPVSSVLEAGELRPLVWLDFADLDKVNLNPTCLATELPAWDGQVKHIIEDSR